jgi:hypothetical protein
VISAAPQALILTATPAQIACFGGQGSVSTNASGGISPYTFSGSPTSGLLAGTYTYSVTDANGCAGTATAVINAAPAQLVMSTTANQIACFGGTGSVTRTASGGTSPYTFSGSSTSGLAAGVYNYTVTDARGCTVISSATINAAPSQLVFSITETQISCFGGLGSITRSTSGGTSPYTFSGSVTTGLTAGTYSYTVTDARGCTATDMAIINPAPTQLNLTVTTSQIS